MPYGRLNERQRKAVSKHIRGKVIHDLGAGDLGLSTELLRLGAAEVYAVDKEDTPRFLPRRLHYKSAYFNEITSRMDTVFLSWPTNHEAHLLPHLAQAQTLIYLGKNTDGTSCGTPALFRAMIRRDLLDYEPDKHNCLVIVGRCLETPREPTGEELAGMSHELLFYSFDKAEAADAG